MLMEISSDRLRICLGYAYFAKKKKIQIFIAFKKKKFNNQKNSKTLLLVFECEKNF